MKQTLTAMLLIVLFSVFAFANEKSGERPTTFDNPAILYFNPNPAVNPSCASCRPID